MSAASAAKRRDAIWRWSPSSAAATRRTRACGIPYYVGGLFDDADRLVSRSPEQHRQAGIDMRVRSEVRAIDLDRRGPHRLRALRAARDRGGLRRARHRDRRASPRRRPSPGPRRSSPRARVDAAERFRAGLERGGGKAVVDRRRLHRAGDGREPRRPRDVGHRDRSGRPGHAHARPRHGRPRRRTAPRRTACASSSRRRSRRSCSTARGSPAACARARASCRSTT